MGSYDSNRTLPFLKCGIATDAEWGSLSPEEIQLFNDSVVCRTYPAGAAVFHEGEKCLGLYFVEDGLLGVRKIGAEGQPVLLRLAHPGDVMGYRPLLAGEAHRASAQVIETAKICFLPKAVMRRLLTSNPALGISFLERTAQALGAADERFFETVTLPVRARFLHLLMVLRERCGRIIADGSLYMELPVTRQDLASMLGIRPESLSRLVHDIENEGIARFSGRTVVISNPDLLVGELDSEIKSL